MTRKRFEASDGVDASNRVVCTHCSTRDRAECHFAVGLLEFAKCVRAVCKLDEGLLGWPFLSSHFFRPIVRLDWGIVIGVVWQSAHFTGDHDRVSHRFRAQSRRTHIVRSAGHRPQFAFLARNLG